jgi:hypothetical protein
MRNDASLTDGEVRLLLMVSALPEEPVSAWSDLMTRVVPLQRKGLVSGIR